MSTTIIRVAKVKNMANVRSAGAHQHRHHFETPNADQERQHLNRVLLGTTNLGADVQGRLDDLTVKPRSNAVIAMDGIMTLSPEVLKDDESINRYTEHATNFIKEKYGDNLVSAVLHLDETSPHIHFTIVPLQEKPDGRKSLNARDMFDKWKLAELQREYYESMSFVFPELDPPEYGSKGEHKKLDVFYAELDEIRKGMKEDAHNFISELKKEAANKMILDITPLINRQLDIIEKAMKKRINKSSREMLIEEQRQALEKNVDDAFNFHPAIEGLEKKINNRINQYKPEAAQTQAKRKFKH